MEVVCAGILVADIFVNPLPALPRAGELLATDDFLIDTGGCAANTATCLARLDVPVSISGKVGADLFGDFVANGLERKKVGVRGLRRSDTLGTSKTIILPVVGEDRRFIHTFGANADYRVADIDLASFAGVRVLCVGGYLVMPAFAPRELTAMMKAARSSGVKTVLDVVVPADDAGTSWPALAAVLPEVDLFLPNDEEARLLTGECEPGKQAERFLRAGCRAVVITRGRHGALYRDRSRSVETGVYKIETVDGSGSGDAFTAGCILGLLEGWEPSKMLRFASAIGASACMRLGCTTGVFTRAEAESFIRGNELCITEHAVVLGGE
jgi:sugar/nucleoside kinase (ribokinase family)